MRDPLSDMVGLPPIMLSEEVNFSLSLIGCDTDTTIFGDAATISLSPSSHSFHHILN